MSLTKRRRHGYALRVVSSIGSLAFSLSVVFLHAALPNVGSKPYRSGSRGLVLSVTARLSIVISAAHYTNQSGPSCLLDADNMTSGIAGGGTGRGLVQADIRGISQLADWDHPGLVGTVHQISLAMACRPDAQSPSSRLTRRCQCTPRDH
jgi:hypothetical protein